MGTSRRGQERTEWIQRSPPLPQSSADERRGGRGFYDAGLGSAMTLLDPQLERAALLLRFTCIFVPTASSGLPPSQPASFLRAVRSRQPGLYPRGQTRALRAEWMRRAGDKSWPARNRHAAATDRQQPAGWLLSPPSRDAYIDLLFVSARSCPPVVLGGALIEAPLRSVSSAQSRRWTPALPQNPVLRLHGFKAVAERNGWRRAGVVLLITGWKTRGAIRW